MDLIETKIVVAVLFGLIRFAFGILPIQICSWLKPTKQDSNNELPPLQNHPLINKSLIYAQCFSGGVFFATCFLYMMPEVNHSITELKRKGVLDSRYPYSQLIVSLGFFFIYFIEEFCHWLIHITPKTPFKCRRHAKIVKELNGVKIEQEEVVTLKSDQTEIIDTNNKEDGDDQSEDSRTQSEELDDIIEDRVITNQHMLRCALIITALSLHSLFEGIAVGLQHSRANIWITFTAISVHSAIMLFYVGLAMFLRGKKVRAIIIRMLFLAIHSPLGVIIGLVLSVSVDSNSEASSLAAVLLEGVSAGTILYITFIEILGKEKERRMCRRTRGFAIGVGFAMIAGLVCVS